MSQRDEILSGEQARMTVELAAAEDEIVALRDAYENLRLDFAKVVEEKVRGWQVMDAWMHRAEAAEAALREVIDAFIGADTLTAANRIQWQRDVLARARAVLGPPPDGIHPRRCECGGFREVGTVCPRCGRVSGREEVGGDRRDEHAAVERDRLTNPKAEGER